MSVGSIPGFTADVALEQGAHSGPNQQRQYRTIDRRLSALKVLPPGAIASGIPSGLIPAAVCGSPENPGTMSVEEYNGSYYVCCCPDAFELPCECTGIV